MMLLRLAVAFCSVLALFLSVPRLVGDEEYRPHQDAIWIYQSMAVAAVALFIFAALPFLRRLGTRAANVMSALWRTVL